MNNTLAMLKDAVMLFVITVIAGLLLGGVYQMTREPIARTEEAAANEAYQQVFTEAAGFEAVTVNTAVSTGAAWTEAGYERVEIDKVLMAADAAGKELGYVLQVTSHEGYGGDITFTMGINMDGSMNGISILAISETAGLGMNAEEVLVPQFAGKNVEQFVLTKGGAAAEAEVDAISGATITSDAFVTGANAGLFYFNTELGGDGNES